MFVLFSFLEALTCEQNMIGNWLQTMGLTALPLPGVAQRVFLLIVAINCQAERQREESKLSTRRIVFDLIPHSLGLNYKKCTSLVGRVWYHKLGLNWTNHDRMPAPRSLCCVFVLAKYRFRLKRLDFFAGSFEKSSKSLNCVGKTLQSSIHSVKRYQRVSQTISCFHKNETTC